MKYMRRCRRRRAAGCEILRIVMFVHVYWDPSIAHWDPSMGYWSPNIGILDSHRFR